MLISIPHEVYPLSISFLLFFLILLFLSHLSSLCATFLEDLELVAHSWEGSVDGNHHVVVVGAVVLFSSLLIFLPLYLTLITFLLLSPSLLPELL